MGRRVAFALACSALLLAGCGQGRPGTPAAPTFRSSPNWVSLTSGTSNAPGWDEAAVWVLSARSNLAAMAPYDFPNNLLHLSRDAIYISAQNDGRSGSSNDVTEASWPLRLSRFRVDHGWEGQPARNVQQRLDWVAVRGWRLDVRVYFATQHPSARMLRTAQRELDRLELPRG